MKPTTIRILCAVTLVVFVNPFFLSASAYAARPSVFEDCRSGCPVMVVIAPGHFQMGPTPAQNLGTDVPPLARMNSMPEHLVRIRDRFALGKTDVTRAQFNEFAEQTRFRGGNDCTIYAIDKTFNATPSGHDWRNPGFQQTENDPVVCVNWDDIRAYLAWLSGKTHRQYRLPSEAEWEYAARGATTSSHYWGDESDFACRYANVRDETYLRSFQSESAALGLFRCVDGYVFTSPAGAFLPNKYGLYDMLGNVAELVGDCWNYSYQGAPTEGATWKTGNCMVRVTRGGAFNDPPAMVNVWLRTSIPRFIRSNTVGFRVARNFP